MWKYKENIGKKEPKKLKKSKLDKILSSDFITNPIVKKNLKKQIKEAKENQK